MSNQASNRFPRPNSSGVQRRPRDVTRMADFLEEKEIRKPGGWASSTEVSEQYLERAKSNPGRQQRNQARAGNWKRDQVKPDAAPVGEETNRFKSTKSTEPVVDQLYNVTQGSRQNVRIRSQNIEHSSYPLLCDVTYRQLKEFAPRIQRELPYPVFLHAMNVYLQSTLIHVVREVNKEPRWQDELSPMALIPQDSLVPEPIAEYLAMINTNITPSGDTVYINCPNQTIP